MFRASSAHHQESLTVYFLEYIKMHGPGNIKSVCVGIILHVVFLCLWVRASWINMNCPTSCFYISLLYFCRLLYMFRVVIPPIIKNTYNCNYCIWHWSNCLCLLPLSWRSWNSVGQLLTLLHLVRTAMYLYDNIPQLLLLFSTPYHL
jgi:hypothetical protein